MPQTKMLSVLVGCYGSFSPYSIRCLQSIVNHCADRQGFDLHVGLNQCCRETVTAARDLLDAGRLDTLIESNVNLNKDPMMRLLVDRAQTPYVLWIDDDTHVLEGWDKAVLEFIRQRHPFEVAGHVHYSHRSGEYLQFLHKRPWWKGDDYYLEPSH